MGLIALAERLMKVRKDNEHILKRSVIGTPEIFVQQQAKLTQRAHKNKLRVARKHTSQNWVRGVNSSASSSSLRS